MGIEPNAAERLRAVARSTPDLRLRRELQYVCQDSHMSFAPSSLLTLDIASCSRCSAPAGIRPGRELLCEQHRDAWDMERCSADDRLGGSLTELFGETLRDSAAGAELLRAYRAQSTALNRVWEAHHRGAVSLPDALVRELDGARREAPSFLAGSERRARIAPM